MDVNNQICTMAELSHSYNKRVLSTDYTPDTIRVSGDTGLSKEMAPPQRILLFWGREGGRQLGDWINT